MTRHPTRNLYSVPGAMWSIRLVRYTTASRPELLVSPSGSPRLRDPLRIHMDRALPSPHRSVVDMRRGFPCIGNPISCSRYWDNVEHLQTHTRKHWRLI